MLKDFAGSFDVKLKTDISCGNPSLTLPGETEVQDPDQISQVVRPVILQKVDLLRFLLDRLRVVTNKGDLVGEDDDLQPLSVEETLCKTRGSFICFI